MRYPIRARQVVDRVRREPVALQGVGADVGEERGVDADDGSVAREPDASVVRLLAVLAHAREILSPALHPLHGPVEPERRRRDQDLLRIDRTFRAEAAADVGHHDPHVLDRQPERHGDRVAKGVRALSGRRDHERAGVAVAIREHAARLDRHGAEPRVPQPLPDDEVRRRQRALGVADAAPRHDRGVVRPAFVKPRR